MADHARAGTSVAELAIAWTVVVVPLLWGVGQVVVSSLALFR
ncbi:MAG TPA: hypothetical protein VFY16_14420 [Gemmatimonadaceae bacterium]|nr:hypothetical protein [Gemmatimonadaceae bacterium]